MTRPVVVLVVGIEGSGHHGFGPLLVTLANERCDAPWGGAEEAPACMPAALNRSYNQTSDCSTHYRSSSLRHALFSHTHPGQLGDLALLRCWKGLCATRTMPSQRTTGRQRPIWGSEPRTGRCSPSGYS